MKMDSKIAPFRICYGRASARVNKTLIHVGIAIPVFKFFLLLLLLQCPCYMQPNLISNISHKVLSNLTWDGTADLQATSEDWLVKVSNSPMRLATMSNINRRYYSFCLGILFYEGVTMARCRCKLFKLETFPSCCSMYASYTCNKSLKPLMRIDVHFLICQARP